MKKIVSAFIAFVFNLTTILPTSYAQTIPDLPIPGVMIMPTASFVPVLIKGITVYPDNPLQFDFIIDKGDAKSETEDLKAESTRLIKYFLASLTVPEEDVWVNLSPYENDRIIPDKFGITEMGRDLLAQDYILKQLTASLMYPEKELGKEFWDKIYKSAKEKFGTTDIPVDTFNKVWIVPEKAVVYEHNQTAYIVEARLRVMLEQNYLMSQVNQDEKLLRRSNDKTIGSRSPDIRPTVGSSGKVMLEQDYVALQHASKMEDGRAKGEEGKEKMENRNGKNENQSSLLDSQSSIIKEIIVPAIEKEVNEGKNFAPLRQIYHSLILAAWFKRNLRESILGRIYMDQNKTVGVDIKDKTEKEKIYNQYLEAFKKGVYNYIREDYDEATQQIIPRKYFSGGVTVLGLNKGNSPILEVTKEITSKIKKQIGNLLNVIIISSVFAAGTGGDNFAIAANPNGNTPPEFGDQASKSNKLYEVTKNTHDKAVKITVQLGQIHTSANLSDDLNKLQVSAKAIAPKLDEWIADVASLLLKIQGTQGKERKAKSYEDLSKLGINPSKDRDEILKKGLSIELKWGKFLVDHFGIVFTFVPYSFAHPYIQSYETGGIKILFHKVVDTYTVPGISEKILGIEAINNNKRMGTLEFFDEDTPYLFMVLDAIKRQHISEIEPLLNGELFKANKEFLTGNTQRDRLLLEKLKYLETSRELAQKDTPLTIKKRIAQLAYHSWQHRDDLKKKPQDANSTVNRKQNPEFQILMENRAFLRELANGGIEYFSLQEWAAHMFRGGTLKQYREGSYRVFGQMAQEAKIRGWVKKNVPESIPEDDFHTANEVLKALGSLSREQLQQIARTLLNSNAYQISEGGKNKNILYSENFDLPGIKPLSINMVPIVQLFISSPIDLSKISDEELLTYGIPGKKFFPKIRIDPTYKDQILELLFPAHDGDKPILIFPSRGHIFYGSENVDLDSLHTTNQELWNWIKRIMEGSLHLSYKDAQEQKDNVLLAWSNTVLKFEKAGKNGYKGFLGIPTLIDPSKFSDIKTFWRQAVVGVVDDMLLEELTRIKIIRIPTGNLEIKGVKVNAVMMSLNGEMLLAGGFIETPQALRGYLDKLIQPAIKVDPSLSIYWEEVTKAWAQRPISSPMEAKVELENKDQVGGIDLNSVYSSIKTQGEGINFISTFDIHELERLPITGFTPIIIKIVPAVNLPLILGFSDENEKNS